MTDMHDGHWQCENVLFNGQRGRLQMTCDELIFGEEKSWQLNQIHKAIPTVASLTLTLQIVSKEGLLRKAVSEPVVQKTFSLSFSHSSRNLHQKEAKTSSLEGIVSFQMESLAHLTRFKKTLAFRQARLKLSSPSNSDAPELRERDTADEVIKGGNIRTVTTDEESKGANPRKDSLQPKQGYPEASDHVDGHSISAEELIDDTNAREILKVVQSYSKSDGPPSSTGFTESSSDSSDCFGGQQLGYPENTSPADSGSQRAESSQGEHSNQSGRQRQKRGPGAYMLQPGAGSSRVVQLDLSLVGNDSTTIEASEVEDSTHVFDYSDELSRSLPVAGNTSSSPIMATVVEESAIVRRPSAAVLPLDNSGHKYTYLRWFFFCACFFAVIICVSTGVLMSIKGDQKSAAVHDDGDDRLALFESLTQHLFSTTSRDTAAIKACDWIADQDRLHLDPSDETQHDKIIQRYILSLFYFHTAENGRWRGCNPPQTGEDLSCRHEVLETYGTEGVYQEQRMTENAFRWLTEADECSWAGVRCEDGEHVSRIGLGDYKLSGPFPAELSQLPRLNALDLQRNQLQSTLPPEFGLGQNHLTILRLDQNRLTGSIPEEWCQMSSRKLNDLILSGNFLTGTIPSCLSEFTKMKNFNVMNNSLSGTIPSDLGVLLHLHTFHVADNHLTGSMPHSLCNLRRYEMSGISADCTNNLSGNYVECECCTSCWPKEDNGL